MQRLTIVTHIGPIRWRIHRKHARGVSGVDRLVPFPSHIVVRSAPAKEGDFCTRMLSSMSLNKTGRKVPFFSVRNDVYWCSNIGLQASPSYT